MSSTLHAVPAHLWHTLKSGDQLIVRVSSPHDHAETVIEGRLLGHGARCTELLEEATLILSGFGRLEVHVPYPDVVALYHVI